MKIRLFFISTFIIAGCTENEFVPANRLTSVPPSMPNMCEQGPAGPKGDKGDKGDTGPKGEKGDACEPTSSLVIYTNIPQGKCHKLTDAVYVWHSGNNIWFKKYSNCNHGHNNEGIYCGQMSQYFDDGSSTICWIGKKQFTVMGFGSNLKIYEITFKQ